MVTANEFGVQQSEFYKTDLDLDAMTLELKLDLDKINMYHHTKNKFFMSKHSKVIT